MEGERRTLLFSMLRGAALLALFAVVGGGGIAYVEQLTRERIVENERRVLLGTLHRIVPPQRHDNDLAADAIEVSDTSGLYVQPPMTVYRASKGGEAVAVIFTTVAPDGYGGPIRLLMGVYRDGSLAGVRVVAHSETPGLGDPIETRRSDWIRDFDGRSLGDPPPEGWTVRRDGGVFDQFTGATITPRAVTGAVQRGLIYFERNRDILFAGMEIPDAEQ
jgi:Na+-translocating ferredoxin:NAD+ oxidoreductase subunit G